MRRVPDPTEPSPQLSPAARAERLTTGQREVLDLGAAGFTSKEIARKLGISSHTVDQRFARARVCFGAADRRDTIRLYRAAILCEPIVYEPSHLHYFTIASPSELPFEDPDWLDNNDAESQLSKRAMKADASDDWLPFATRKGQKNELTLTQRIFWLAAIMIFAIIGVRVVLESLLDLSDLLTGR